MATATSIGRLRFPGAGVHTPWLLALWIVALWFLAVALSPPVVAAEGKRLALLIGNQAYAEAIGPLKNPHNDVDAVGKALEKIGFEVTIERDADYRAMDIALKRHVRQLRSAGKNAIGFFYYSGHGVANEDTGINYLVPTDVEHARDDGFWDAAYEQRLIINRLRDQADNATHYVVFDACRNELKLKTRADKNISQRKGMLPAKNSPGILIAYATAPGATASDAGDGIGPYAKILAEELLRPGLESVMMFRNVQLRVKKAIDQEPWVTFPSLPEIYLGGKEAPKPPPTPVFVPAPTAAAPPAIAMNMMMGNCLRAPIDDHAPVVLDELARHLDENRYEVGWQQPYAVYSHPNPPLDHPSIMWSGVAVSRPTPQIIRLNVMGSGDILDLLPVAQERTEGAQQSHAIQLQGVWSGGNGAGCLMLTLTDKGGRGFGLNYPVNTRRFPIFMRPGPATVQGSTSVATLSAKAAAGNDCAQVTGLASRLACSVKAASKPRNAASGDQAAQ